MNDNLPKTAWLLVVGATTIATLALFRNAWALALLVLATMPWGGGHATD